MGKAFERAAKWLHGKGDFTPEMMREAPVRALINETAATLNEGISLGVDGITISKKLAEGLRGSTYMFSGFKSFHEMKEAAGLLVDENGNQKPFSRYLKDVQAINSKYNVQYLKAEYEFASASAQMAAKWEELSEDEDRYDLQYRTAGDGKVRKAHRELDGITLPASDPFWDNYYPPNGWNCRCTVAKVRKGKYEASDSKQAIDKGKEATAGKHQEMFRFHPGKQRAAYPAYNSYTIAKCGTCSKEGFKLAKVPNNELCQVCGIVKEMKAAKEKQGIRRKETQKEAAGLKDTVLSNSGFNKGIRVTGRGIKEWLNQPFKYYTEKNEMLPDIANVIKESTYVGWTAYHKENPMYVKSHIFETSVKEAKAWIIVREDAKGEMILHSISDSDKVLNGIKK